MQSSTAQFGITHLSLIPVRAEASDKSEMVNQLLFGETFNIIARDRQWVHIRASFDQYEGWIDEKQFLSLSSNDYQALQAAPNVYALEVIHHVLHISDYFPLLLGSKLSNFDGRKIHMANRSYAYLGETTFNLRQDKANAAQIIGYAFKYLHAPYLWGGRSPFGIDCSGLTQMAFKLGNISLPRDAYQQAEIGSFIEDFTQIQVGDLAFFSNDSGKVIHVGIILKNNNILHASGKVRVDKLHESGIFNIDSKKYSHKLSSVKRCI